MTQPDIRIIILIVILAVLFPLLSFYFRRGKKSREGVKKTYSKDTLQRTKMVLQQNPDDVRALQLLAKNYFDNKQWKQAVDTYDRILQIAKKEDNVFSIDIPHKLGIAALHARMYSRAVEALELARAIREDSFDVNLNLGKAEYLRKNFKKAILYFQWILSVKPGHPSAVRLLGLSLVHTGRGSEAQELLAKAHAYNPDDGTVQFHLAKSLLESGQTARALDLFSGLTKNLQFGSYALLKLGIEKKDTGHVAQAIDYFKQGLAFLNVPQEIYLDLNYRIAECYVKISQIKEGKKHLNKIIQVDPTYKDVNDKIEIYNSKWLYVYLSGSPHDFTSLAHKIIKKIIRAQNVSIGHRRSSLHGEETSEEFSAKIQKAAGLSENILFYFIRHRRIVSDIVVRSIQSTIKDVDYSTAYCISPKEFSDHALEFVHGRAIKLIDKQALVAILDKI